MGGRAEDRTAASSGREDTHRDSDDTVMMKLMMRRQERAAVSPGLSLNPDAGGTGTFLQHLILLPSTRRATHEAVNVPEVEIIICYSKAHISAPNPASLLS